jgi:hypothetical protein
VQALAQSPAPGLVSQPSVLPVGQRNSVKALDIQARAARGEPRHWAGIAVFAVATSMSTPGAACAQSSLPVPDSAQAAPALPQATATSAWDTAEPWRTDRFYFETSVYTHHFEYNPEHDDHQHLIAAEWNITQQWLVGASAFDNSFDQPTQYVYGGYRFRPFEGLQPLYLKLSAGLVHGYTGQHQNSIPLNSLGTAPAILPALGYCLNRFCSELVVFGVAGVLVTFGITVPGST